MLYFKATISISLFLVFFTQTGLSQPQNTEADRIIFTDGTAYYLEYGDDVSTILSFSDAQAVIQQAINDVKADGGGKVFIKPGQYPLNSVIKIEDVKKLTIEGTDGTVISTSSSIGTAIRIDLQSDKITLHRLTFKDCSQIAINCISGTNIKITDCCFDSIQSSAIQGRVSADPDKLLENVWILRCHIIKSNVDPAYSGTSARGGIYFHKTQNLFIENNIVEECGSGGITIANHSSSVICNNNIVKNNDSNSIDGQGHGIYIGACDNVTISGNLISGNGGNGIEAASGEYTADGDRGPLFIITDNIVIDNGKHRTTEATSASYRSGIYITGRDNIVSNNTCRDNWANGIQVGYADRSSRIIVQGNIVGNNNRGEATQPKFGSGIVCSGPAGSDNTNYDQLVLIQDNLVYNDENCWQIQAIFCVEGSDGITIEGNRVEGHLQPQIYYDPTSTLITVRRNKGFRTETTGYIEVASPSPKNYGIVPIDLSPYLDIDDIPGIRLNMSYFDVSIVDLAKGSLGGYFNYWVEQTSDTTFELYWDSEIPRHGVNISYIYDKF